MSLRLMESWGLDLMLIVSKNFLFANWNAKIDERHLMITQNNCSRRICKSRVEAKKNGVLLYFDVDKVVSLG